MTDRKTELDDHSALSGNILKNIEEFIDEVGNRGCTAHIESVTTDGKFLKGSKLGQPPERFMEDHLIFPVLRTLGHSVRPRPIQYAPKWNYGRGIPDFALTTISPSTAKEHGVRLFGEAKPPNKLEYAKEDVKEYLQKDLDFHAVAILTDGIEWELWIRPRNQPLELDQDGEYEPDATASLHDALGHLKARNLENHSYHAHNARGKLNEDAFSGFTATSVLDTVQSNFDLAVNREE